MHHVSASEMSGNIHFVTRVVQENWDFKAAEHQQNDCSSSLTTFEGLKVPKGSSSIRKTSSYKQRNHQKSIRKLSMLENERLVQKKKTLVSTVSGMVKNMEGKSVMHSKDPLLSAAIIQKRLERSTRLLHDRKHQRSRILIFSDKKTFTVDPVFNK